MITWTSLISGNGVSYNIYNAKCCNDVVTNGVNWFASACCETVGYSYLNAMCCDGVVVEGISWTNGDSCPTETQTGMYVSH